MKDAYWWRGGRPAHGIELHINAGSLRVDDPNVSEKDRTEIQMTMLGGDVLDVRGYPAIVFRSTIVGSIGRF